MSCSVRDMTLMINSRDMTPCSLVDVQPTKVSDYPECKRSTFLRTVDTYTCIYQVTHLYSSENRNHS